MSTSIVNGVMTQSTAYTYSLMRTRPGTCTIGPALIRVAGQELSTKPITIEIVQGRPKAQGEDPGSTHDVFLRAVIPDKIAYPGQQVRLDYKVYTTVNIRNYNTLTEDSYEQFYYRYVQDFARKAQLEVVDGVQYTVQTIKSLALFPQQTGTFGIAPMVASLGLSLKSDRPSFIFGTRTVPVTVASDSAYLKVIPLPGDPPPAFTGAVGTYRMNATINTQQLSTDDALILNLDIIGSGDPKRWTAPDLSGLKADFELYDPRITTDESVDQGGEIRHRRTIEYLMIPRRAGDQTLQVAFAYFDPDSATYRTLATPLYHLTVTQGTRRTSEEQFYSADAASMTLRGLKPIGRTWHTQFLFSPLYFVLMSIPVIGLGVVFWIRRKQDLLDALDPVEKKRRKARRIAEQHLQEAQVNLDGQERAFYDSLSRAIFSYISAKLNIPASELSKATIYSQLERLELTLALRTETLEILNTS